MAVPKNDIIKLSEETKKLTAMIVEDEEDVNELLASSLGKFFKDMHRSTSGKEALEFYSSAVDEYPDVIFMDIMMPEMDGIELSRKIRAINPSQIIIIISASNDIGKIGDSITLGLNSFIQKPLNTVKIIETLENIVTLAAKKKKTEVKTFSISLPLDLYEYVDESAKAESISKNAVIIRGLRTFYNLI